MLAKLLLLFIIVPAIELFLLIEIGRQVGALPTLGLIIFTGALGAFLVKRQGLQILQKIQMEMSDGRLPAEALVDGLIILLAGAFLMTPGILTDTVGFLCLIPAARAVIKKVVWRRLERTFQNAQVYYHNPTIVDAPYEHRPPPDNTYDA